MDETCDVPIERYRQMLGKSPWLQSVLIDCGEIGDLIEVEITTAGADEHARKRRPREGYGHSAVYPSGSGGA
jgi:hypothetical protein